MKFKVRVKNPPTTAIKGFLIEQNRVAPSPEKPVGDRQVMCVVDGPVHSSPRFDPALHSARVHAPCMDFRLNGDQRLVNHGRGVSHGNGRLKQEDTTLVIWSKSHLRFLHCLFGRLTADASMGKILLLHCSSSVFPQVTFIEDPDWPAVVSHAVEASSTRWILCACPIMVRRPPKSATSTHSSAPACVLSRFPHAAPRIGWTRLVDLKAHE